MPNVTVFNLHTEALTVSGGYYTAPIPAAGNATFEVVDTDEFVKLPANVALVDGGFIRIELEADSQDLRPIMTVPDDAGLAALVSADYPDGFLVCNVGAAAGAAPTDFVYVNIIGTGFVAVT